MTATPEAPQRTDTPERPPRSVPRVSFTDAEAGAKEFPDSDASARRYNYYKPAKRKQTHYEDVTVEVQPDPRHYLSQGLDLRLRRRAGRLPAELDQAQGLGRRRAGAAARSRHRRPARPELAGARLARVP